MIFYFSRGSITIDVIYLEEIVALFTIWNFFPGVLPLLEQHAGDSGSDGIPGDGPRAVGLPKAVGGVPSHGPAGVGRGGRLARPNADHAVVQSPHLPLGHRELSA